MPVSQHLLALLMARSTVERVSARYGVSAYDLRTLASVHALRSMGKAATVRSVAELQGLGVTLHTRTSVAQLRKAGLLTATGGGTVRIVADLSPAGLRMVGLLEREERDARRRAQSVTVSRKKRVYVKSGKFVGKAAKQRARKEGAGE